MRISDWSSDVCSSDLTAGRLAEFDTFELERADLKTLFETFRMALGRAGEPGFLSANEVRRLINYNRVENGDAIHNGEKSDAQPAASPVPPQREDGRSEEQTSEHQSLMRISYAAFCSKKNNTTRSLTIHIL